MSSLFSCKNNIFFKNLHVNTWNNKKYLYKKRITFQIKTWEGLYLQFTDYFIHFNQIFYYYIHDIDLLHIFKILQFKIIKNFNDLIFKNHYILNVNFQPYLYFIWKLGGDWMHLFLTPQSFYFYFKCYWVKFLRSFLKIIRLFKMIFVEFLNKPSFCSLILLEFY